MGKLAVKMVLLVLIFALVEVGYAQEMDAPPERCRVKYADMLKCDIADARNAFEAAYVASEQAAAEEDRKAGPYTCLGLYQGCVFPLVTYAIVYNAKKLYSDEKFRENERSWEMAIIGTSLVSGYLGGSLCSRADKPYHWGCVTHAAFITTLVVLLSVYMD